MKQAEEAFDAALDSLLAAIDAIAAERGWSAGRRRQVRTRVLHVRSLGAATWLDWQTAEASRGSQLAARVLELIQRADWNEAESALNEAIQCVWRIPPRDSNDCASIHTGDHSTVHSWLDTKSDISLHGEPGQAPSKMPVPPKPAED